MSPAPIASRPVHVGIIGYGEAGQIFAQGLVASGNYAVTAYDLQLGDSGDTTVAATMYAAATAAGVTLRPTLSAAIAEADIIISAVTASAAISVMQQVAALMHSQQAQQPQPRFIMDINSISPAAKQQGFALISAAGGNYVEAAVMASIPPYGLAVPIMLGGPHAAPFTHMMASAGMNLTIAAAEIGVASAIKMCRSVMIKGLEALTIESLFTARHYGVEEQVIASLNETFPGLDWRQQADYLVSRVVQHGRRRAAELREVARTVDDAGLTPWLSSAIAERQDWMADQVQAGIVSKSAKQWRAVADSLADSLATASDNQAV